MPNVLISGLSFLFHSHYFQALRLHRVKARGFHGQSSFVKFVLPNRSCYSCLPKFISTPFFFVCKSFCNRVYEVLLFWIRRERGYIKCKYNFLWSETTFSTFKWIKKFISNEGHFNYVAFAHSQLSVLMI